jgi:hypothetical protein
MSSADQQNQARNGGFPAFLGIGGGGPIVHIRAVNYYISVGVSRVRGVYTDGHGRSDRKTQNECPLAVSHQQVEHRAGQHQSIA